MHVAFANEAAHLANEKGDTNGFLLPTVRNQLPEAVKNTLKSLGKKPKTWDEFRKALAAIPLSDLHKEATEIARWDSFYAKVAALQIGASGLTPTTARATYQPRQAPMATQNWVPTPHTMLPGTPPPKYQNPPTTPQIPTQNRPPFGSHPRSSPLERIEREYPPWHLAREVESSLD